MSSVKVYSIGNSKAYLYLRHEVGLIFQVPPSYDWLWLDLLSETSLLRELQVNSE